VRRQAASVGQRVIALVHANGHTARRPRTRSTARHRSRAPVELGWLSWTSQVATGSTSGGGAPHLPQCASAFIRAEHVCRSGCEGHVRAAGAPRRGPRLCDARGRTRAPQRTRSGGDSVFRSFSNACEVAFWRTEKSFCREPPSRREPLSPTCRRRTPMPT